MFLCISCKSDLGKTSFLGEIVYDQRDLPYFDEINISSGINLLINQGLGHKVVVNAVKNIQDEIKTEVDNGELKIYYNKSFWSVNNIIVEITVRDLKHL